ncbi:hypothetical protein CI593_08280 [Fischerella thermalis CCMEE 5194]|nr:hypothetical protein [Fischerella thermalis]PLZ90832.1 hypothetical protein CI593_08280 [Fischerella thermalis CCMEE 5194]
MAIDGIAIAVNPHLKVPDLSVAQIKDIYTGKISSRLEKESWIYQNKIIYFLLIVDWCWAKFTLLLTINS